MTSRVEIKILPKSDVKGSGLQLSVGLWSHNRKDLKAQVETFIGQHESYGKLRDLAGASAGALAEYLNELYGDKHDPSECAKVAAECLDKMVADYQQYGRLREHTLTI